MRALLDISLCEYDRPRSIRWALWRLWGLHMLFAMLTRHVNQDPVETNTFWVNPFGVAFSQIRSSDLIRVGEGAKVIEGGEVYVYQPCSHLSHRSH